MPWVVLAGGPEGSGVAAQQSWVLPAFGTAREYIHLLNPSMPKVLMYLYGEEPTGFSSTNSLQVTSTYSPNGAAGGLFGNAGDAFITTANGGIFNVGDHLLLHQTVHPTEAGKWELATVTSISGGQINLAQPLQNSYETNRGNTSYAQAVVAASFDTLDVLGGGEIRPPQGLDYSDQADFKGGIVYIRARQITVRSGGKIHANGTDPTKGQQVATALTDGAVMLAALITKEGASYCNAILTHSTEAALTVMVAEALMGVLPAVITIATTAGLAVAIERAKNLIIQKLLHSGWEFLGDELDGLLKMGGGVCGYNGNTPEVEAAVLSLSVPMSSLYKPR